MRILLPLLAGAALARRQTASPTHHHRHHLRTLAPSAGGTGAPVVAPTTAPAGDYYGASTAAPSTAEPTSSAPTTEPTAAAEYTDAPAAPTTEPTAAAEYTDAPAAPTPGYAYYTPAPTLAGRTPPPQATAAPLSADAGLAALFYYDASIYYDRAKFDYANFPHQGPAFENAQADEAAAKYYEKKAKYYEQLAQKQTKQQGE